MTSISDIAKKVSVAKSTVSRVLNNHPHVSDKTREKVMAAIAELDYSPNQVARDLSRGKTMKIGVVIPHTRHPYFTQLINGLLDAAKESHYQLVMMSTMIYLMNDSQLMDSAHPASGLALVRPHLTGKEFVRFAIALQKAFYQDGADLSKPDVYLTLAQAFGVADKVSKEEVAQALVDKTLASADFDFTAKCGIQSYPTFLLNKGDKWYDLRGQASSGEELFANYQYLLELDK